MMRRGMLLVVFSVSVTVAGAGAGGQQARDVTTAAPTGTAHISGRVVTFGEDPRPLRRAIVTITGEGLKSGRSTIGDDQGRFAFDGLPAGRFVVTGSRAAFLPGAYGADQPGRDPVPIQLAAGERRTDVVFPLARGGVLTGVLHTELGETAPNVEVAAFRVPPAGTNWRLILAATGTTDDRGVYRLFQLPPGEYYVVASLRRRLSAAEATRWTSEQIDGILRRLKEPDAAAPVEPGGLFGYAPVFFPGGSSPEGAASIRLKAGEEHAGVNFTVPLTRLATIEGTLIGSGDLSRVQFFFTPVGIQLPSLLGTTPSFSTTMGPAGRTFTYAGVVPGRYTVTAHLPSETTTWARTEVTVTGQDVSGLTLALQPAWTVRGRVVFDGDSRPRPESASAISLRAAPANGLDQSATNNTRMGNPTVPPARVGADGRFEIGGLLNDTYRLSGSVSGGSGWWLRSVVVNGIDVLDQDFIVNGDVPDALFTFSDRQTTLSGRLETASGRPGASLFVVVFPEDRTLWRPQARRITSARADTDGSWIVRGLPAGGYRLAAVTDLAVDEVFNPSFLDALSGASIAVTLAEGEQKIQNLRIGGEF
jgi:hypothetical protein